MSPFLFLVLYIFVSLFLFFCLDIIFYFTHIFKEPDFDFTYFSSVTYFLNFINLTSYLSLLFFYSTSINKNNFITIMREPTVSVLQLQAFLVRVITRCSELSLVTVLNVSAYPYLEIECFISAWALVEAIYFYPIFVFIQETV